MKIRFPKQPTAQIISSITQSMAGRGLGDMVSLQEEDGNLLVKISKLGTSVLTFSRQDTDEHTELALSNEKIAFAHKAFKDEVTGKLVQVIQKAGGTVV